MEHTLQNYKNVKISIIGGGIVGEAAGRGLQSFSYDVIFYDTNRNKLRHLRKLNLNVTDKIDDITNTDISFICVPTPNGNNGIDLSYVREAAVGLGYAIKEKDDYHLCVVKSTVIPGTTENIVIPILESSSEKKNGHEFGVVVNPEFLRSKSALYDFLHPDRIVIGSDQQKPSDLLIDLYEPLKTSIIMTDFRTAETIKYIANIFLASKISFFNDIDGICKEIGADSRKVSDAVSKDRRIGEYGTIGGLPFDDICLGKDLAAFVKFLEDANIDARMIKETKRINDKLEK